MRIFFAAGLLAMSLLPAVAPAQVFGPNYNRSPYREPLFDRVQADLSRAMEHAYNRGRISHAQRELGKLQAERAAGRFADHQFRKAVNALDSVVRGNGLDPRDRDLLAHDLQALRGSAGRYGYR